MTLKISEAPRCAHTERARQRSSLALVAIKNKRRTPHIGRGFICIRRVLVCRQPANRSWITWNVPPRCCHVYKRDFLKLHLHGEAAVGCTHTHTCSHTHRTHSRVHTHGALICDFRPIRSQRRRVSSSSPAAFR